MSRIIAVGAVSALGLGRAAYDVTRLGEPAPVAIRDDAALALSGLRRPFTALAPAELGPLPALVGGDRAAELLGAALGQLVSELDRVHPRWRADRVGVAIGTSSGGMLSAERFFAAPDQASVDLARGSTYFAPLDRALEAFGLRLPSDRHGGPLTQVLAACASSTIAIGMGARWLEVGDCDVVIAGGYDAVSLFVAAGFEALRATTASRPRPFRVGRDGMALGEGAGLAAMVRGDDERARGTFAYVSGFGASTDAVHITAPDRTGSGLARAAAAALADAGLAPSEVGLVSTHASATPFNDAMESRAMASVFANAAAPVVHPFKAQIGHTLGAAGALELLAVAECLRCGVAPAAAGEGPLDPDAPARLLDRAEPSETQAALKLSAAFGGANAALVVSVRASHKTPPLPPPRVAVSAYAHVTDVDLIELAEATGVARDRLARLDALCRLGLLAVARLASRLGRERLVGAGVVAGQALATFETNARFDERKRSRPTLVEPRLFPATSPNALPGEIAIVFGMTGPSFAVGAGLDAGTEALRAGVELVASRAAARVVVVAADDAGPASLALMDRAGWRGRRFSSGAVAALLEVGADGATSLDPRTLVADHDAAPVGHLALLDRLTR